MPDGITPASLCRFGNEGSGLHLRSVSVVVLPAPKVVPALVECDEDDEDDEEEEEEEEV